MAEDTCIYCQQVVAVQRGEGDHVIPARLGRFEEDYPFRRICRNCNSRIGKCEEQLLRCAPEACLLRIVQPAVKRRNRGTSWVGANGMPAPKFKVDCGDHHELAEGSTDDPRTVYAVDNLVVIDKEKNERPIRLFPEMSVAGLRREIEALGVTPDRIYLNADEATSPKYLAILRELYTGMTFVETEGSEAGVHQVKGRMEFTFREDYYYRAIAKIGFHYYLCNSRRGKRGDEPEFADIRCFIMDGGDREPFFNKPTAQFALPFGERPDGSAILPSKWGHVLAADETRRNAVAMVSLFMGPEYLAQTHHIFLGRFNTSLIVPAARHAHVYEYYAEPSQSSYAGRAIAVTTTRLR